MDDEAFFTDDIIKGKSVMGYSPVGGSGGQNELLRAGAHGPKHSENTSDTYLGRGNHMTSRTKKLKGN